MAKCSAIKANGQRCERIVGASQSYCYSHDPARAKERSTNASKAAKSKGPGVEIVEVKGELKKLAQDVLSGKTTTARGSVTATIYGVLIRALEQERRILETQELAERLERLEASYSGGGGNSRWR